MILSHTISQPNKSGFDTALEIEVRVDDATYQVEHIMSIKAFCYRTLTQTDITYILTEHFPSMLDNIYETDWREIALAQEPEPERSELFEQVTSLVRNQNRFYGF